MGSSEKIGRGVPVSDGRRYGIDVPDVKPYLVNMASVAPPEREPRALRADARRNRERIVKAARAVFAQHGRDAQMDDVARRAKVGVGTVYRHFPTKEGLIEAVAADKFEGLTREATAALAAEDPWEAFERFVWYAAEQVARDRTLFEVMGTTSCQLERATQTKLELQAAVGELMRRAQAAGALRPEAGPQDMGMIMCAIGGAMAVSGTDDWQRLLRYVLDGLRAPSLS
jgi:AcrR family transcriptional regulator